MKKMLFILIGLGITLQSFGQIVFETGTWAEVKAKAKRENKMIFVDAYAVWCGPCKWMAQNTFTDKKVGEYYNANFVNYKFDMEKGEGPKFAREFRVEAYPTLLYFTANGKEAHRSEGSEDATGFLAKGKSVNGETPVENNQEEINVVEAEITENTPDWLELNNQAWAYYENETDRDKLEQAADWAKKSIALEQNYYNTDTYAHLLHKLGKKTDALKWANISVKLGKEIGQDVSATEQLIQKINNKK
jgi:thiol-disulfide isomerase/thioredoxin